MISFRCSDAAADRADPMIGTAPPQRDWLLVEHPGPWPASAPFGTDLPTDLVRGLGHPDLRVLLVRPFGRQPAREDRRWFRCVAGVVRTGTWREPADLAGCASAAAGTPYDGPLLLVCTHGVHDLCCAVKGRPVAAALSERWPDRTWECSHLGGDRFAASVLVLPDLVCFGGVTGGSAVPTVEAHLAGRTEVATLRGVAGLHPAEQVAQATVLDRWGPAPVSAVRPAIVDQQGTFADGRWTVRVSGSLLPDPVAVVVTSRKDDATQLTCGATRTTAATRWTVESVSSGTGAPLRPTSPPTGSGRR